MTKSTTDRQHCRALKSLLGKGIAATAVGALLVLSPQFPATHLTSLSPTPSLATVLRIAGFILLLLGLGTLVLRHSVRSKAKKLSHLRRGGSVAEQNKRLSYVTRGAPLGLAHGFPVTPDATDAAHTTNSEPAKIRPIGVKSGLRNRPPQPSHRAHRKSGSLAV